MTRTVTCEHGAMNSAWHTVTGYRPASARRQRKKANERQDKGTQMQQSVTLDAAAGWTFCVGAADMDGAMADDAVPVASIGAPAPPPSALNWASAFVLRENPRRSGDRSPTHPRKGRT